MKGMGGIGRRKREGEKWSDYILASKKIKKTQGETNIP